jgi:hypothetical protein
MPPPRVSPPLFKITAEQIRTLFPKPRRGPDPGAAVRGALTTTSGPLTQPELDAVAELAAGKLADGRLSTYESGFLHLAELLINALDTRSEAYGQLVRGLVGERGTPPNNYCDSREYSLRHRFGVFVTENRQPVLLIEVLNDIRGMEPDQTIAYFERKFLKGAPGGRTDLLRLLSVPDMDDLLTSQIETHSQPSIGDADFMKSLRDVLSQPNVNDVGFSRLVGLIREKGRSDPVMVARLTGMKRAGPDATTFGTVYEKVLSENKCTAKAATTLLSILDANMSSGRGKALAQWLTELRASTTRPEQERIVMQQNTPLVMVVTEASYRVARGQVATSSSAAAAAAGAKLQ